MAKKNLKISLFVENDNVCDLLNACDSNGSDFIDAALSIPVIKKGFKQHLLDSGITEGLTENTVEAGFSDWFMEMIAGSEVTVSFDLESFKG